MPPALTTRVRELSLKRIEQIASKFVIETNGCWKWIGNISSIGYGVQSIKRKNRLAHRVFWELTGHQFIEKMVLNHLCENKLCVNPSHLEQVTTLENLHYSMTLARVNKNKTHCKHGHEFTDSNTRILIVAGRPRRGCRTCAVKYSTDWNNNNLKRINDRRRQRRKENKTLWD